MTSVLVSSWAFSPWRDEAATTAAARLLSDGARRLDVVRADLDDTRPREQPRPEVDDLIGRSISLPGHPVAPSTWAGIESYAAAAAGAVRAWQAAGVRWDGAYSGPAGLADHLVLALLRERAVVPGWTAHLTDPPNHLASGRALTATVSPGPLRTACRALLDADPVSDFLGDWALAVVAARADRVVVATAALGEHLLARAGAGPRDRLADRMEVWSRPACPVTAAPGGAGESGDVRVTARVDRDRLAQLQPVLTAYGLLPEAARPRLHLLTNVPADVAVLLRESGLEGLVSLAPDLGPAASAATAAAGDYALVLDRPRPAGLPYALGDLPEIGDHAAYGTPVILLVPQDSPLTRLPVAHHVPDQHPSAVAALFSRLAGAAVPARG